MPPHIRKPLTPFSLDFQSIFKYLNKLNLCFAVFLLSARVLHGRAGAGHIRFRLPLQSDGHHRETPDGPTDREVQGRPRPAEHHRLHPAGVPVLRLEPEQLQRLVQERILQLRRVESERGEVRGAVLVLQERVRYQHWADQHHVRLWSTGYRRK